MLTSLGGMDRLKCYYVKQGRDLGFSNVKVFSRKFPDMLKRLKSFSGIVICTGNVAHTMVEGEELYHFGRRNPFPRSTLSIRSFFTQDIPPAESPQLMLAV